MPVSPQTTRVPKPSPIVGVQQTALPAWSSTLKLVVSGLS